MCNLQKIPENTANYCSNRYHRNAMRKMFILCTTSLNIGSAFCFNLASQNSTPATQNIHVCISMDAIFFPHTNHRL